MFIEINNNAVDARRITHYSVTRATPPTAKNPMYYLDIWVDTPRRDPIHVYVTSEELAFFKEQLNSYTRIVSYTKEEE